MADELRRQVRARSAGEPLPSTRELAARHGVGPVTVSRALAQLSAEGIIVTEPGRGTFVAAAAGSAATQPIDVGWQTVALQGRAVDTEDLMRQVALPDSGAIVLSTGYLDPSLQPTRAMADALARGRGGRACGIGRHWPAWQNSARRWPPGSASPPLTS